MREIIFRGKNTESKNWIYGSLLIKDESPIMIMTSEGYKHEVISETVGQFTGKKDVDEQKIFEGDVLKSHGLVIWNDEEFKWSCMDLNWNDRKEIHEFDYLTSEFKLIGNSTDNPELLD